MRLSAAREALLSELAAESLAAIGPVPGLIAIDGVDGAGKTVFADQLARQFDPTGRRVVRASVDGFHHSRAIRYRRGRDSAEGFWLDSYDYPRLRAELLDPIRAGRGTYRTAVHDVAADPEIDSRARTVYGDEIVIVDGIFLHRDELWRAWSWSVFIDVPFAVSVARMAARDGSPADPADPAVARYVDGQQRYLAACEPWRRATAVVDNTDLERPVRTAARSG